ncbi:MAG: hypothetical protein ACOX6Q_03300 [Candidatus Dojkabacteria bacterium]|jgi:hypothetical protein
MKKERLIPLDEFEKENFTEEQLKRINKEVEKRIALRRLKKAKNKTK